MTEPTEAARQFRDEQEAGEDALDTLLSVDDTHDTWTFQDVDIDSGTFGEVVSRGIVEKVDGEYRLANPDGVRRVLSGKESETKTADSSRTASGFERPSLDVDIPSYSLTFVLAFLAALATVVGARLLIYRSVFQGEYVVSPGNDPYFYRYWQHEMLAESDGLFDLSMLANYPGDGRAMTHIPNWWFAEVLGGTPEAAATVAAWAPIVGAVLGAVVLYLVAVTVTRDQRVGLTAVVLVGLTPVHTVYTNLGFLEHRLYQYFWLLVVVFALAWLATDFTRRLAERSPGEAANDHLRDLRTWGIALVLTVGTFASVHVWAGSPLTFGAVTLYLGFRILLDVRRDVPPLTANAPALGGLGIGALLAYTAYVRWGWHEQMVVTVPLLVVVGGIAVAVIGEVWRRRDLPVAGLFVGESLIAIVGTIVYFQLRPADLTRLQARAESLFGREEIIEAQSLFSAEGGIIFTPMFQIGFSFFLAVVAILVVSWLLYRQYRPGWLVLTVFAWYYLILAALQARFSAQLALFLATFASLSILFLLSKVDLVRRPRFESAPQQSELVTVRPPSSPAVGLYIGSLLGGILLMNLIFVPMMVSDAAHGPEVFGATTAIIDHSDSWDVDHPEFVLSHWPDNRMHNYFQTGESREYGYALRYHQSFITDVHPDEWYEQFAGEVGYVVVKDRNSPPETSHHVLFHELGAGEFAASHYQLIYSSAEVKAFAVVPGAEIEVVAVENETISARTEVESAGQSFMYEIERKALQNATISIPVAYPGEYELAGETVSVTETDVLTGSNVSVERQF